PYTNLQSFPTRRSSDLCNEMKQIRRNSMKSSLYSKFLAVTMTLFLAASAFAASGVSKGDFKISDPVQVGDKQLPAGDYVAKWKGDRKSTRLNSSHLGIS